MANSSGVIGGPDLNSGIMVPATGGGGGGGGATVPALAGDTPVLLWTADSRPTNAQVFPGPTIFGTSAPTNTAYYWGDTTTSPSVLKYYDPTLSTWIQFNGSGGVTLLNGSGAPTSTPANGTYYIDVGGGATNGQFWQYQSGTWVLLTTIAGAAGASVTGLGAWASGTSYVVNDLVSYGGGSYLAVASSTGVTPGTDPTKWMQIAAPFPYTLLVDGSDTTPGTLAVKLPDNGFFAWSIGSSGGNETYNLTISAQSANTFLCGPASGSAAAPTFRSLTTADIPSLAASKITTGQISLAQGGTAADLSATGGPGQFLKQASTGASVQVAGIVSGDLPVATTSAFGAVKPDGSTITISGGVLSAPGGGGGVTANAEVTGNSNAPDYALTGSLTTIQPAGCSPLGLNLATGKYLIIVTLAVSGATAGDQIEAQVYNQTASVAFLTSLQYVQMVGTGEGELELTFSVNVASTSQLVIQAANTTAARGVVKLARSKIDALQIASASTSIPQIVTASFTPIYGLSGTTVTLNGYGFTGATSVVINGTAASSFTVVSDTQITATVPTETPGTSGPITVTTGAGTATTQGYYYYQSSSPIGIKGYVLGGIATGGIAEALGNKTVFSTDTTSAVTSANLGSATRSLGAVGDGGTNGYLAGGTTSYSGTAPVSTMYQTFGATDTTSTSVNSLPTAQGYFTGGGLSDRSTTGYLLGGITSGSSANAVATGFTIALSSGTPSAAASSLNLSTARLDGGYLNASTWGYIIGGASKISTPTYYAIGDKVVFSTSTTSATSSSNATASANWGTGNSGDGSTKGYLMGNFTSSTSVTAIDKTVYSTDTTSALSGVLSTARATGGGLTDSSTKSYMIGGASGGGGTSADATADKIAHSTDTVAAVSSANLATAVFSPAAFSDSGI